MAYFKKITSQTKDPGEVLFQNIAF